MGDIEPDPKGLYEDFRYLSIDERKQAGRFHRISDRQRYIFSHVMSRIILSEYIGCKPGDVIYKRKDFGKPEIDGINRSIKFNLSHSENIILLAVSEKHEVGVDVEFIRELTNMDSLFEFTLTNDERRYINEFSTDQKIKIFYRLWTLKESLVKGLGEGLSIPLNTISVLSDNFIRSQTEYPIAPKNEKKDWKIFVLDIDFRYAGAVAVGGSISSVKLFHFEDHLKKPSLCLL